MNNFLLTYPWIFRKQIGDSKTILDLGCGDGEFTAAINFDKKFEITGVDLFSQYIRQAKATGAFKKVVKADIKTFKVPAGTFDAAISSQVIEHLYKKEGAAHLKLLEKAAKNRVVIGTPNGHFHREIIDHNDLQEHHSGWSVADFEKYGYRVYGQGLKLVYGEHGLLQSFLGKITLFRNIFIGLSFLTSPYVYFHPNQAAHLIAVKNKK